MSESALPNETNHMVSCNMLSVHLESRIRMNQGVETLLLLVRLLLCCCL